jgi:(hydroxyamino)benzene mutase
MENAARRLMWYGMFLFLMGLFTGFAEPHFANIRMGLAAHLEGVMNGIFLLAVGSVWPHLRLARGAKAAAFWTTLYGTYMNWVFTSLAAIFGTGALSPITAPGLKGQAWQESLVKAGLMTVGVAIVIAAVLLLSGLRGGAPQES